MSGADRARQLGEGRDRSRGEEGQVGDFGGFGTSDLKPQGDILSTLVEEVAPPPRPNAWGT